MGRSMFAPYNKRDPVLNGNLHRIGRYPTVGMPVHVALQDKAGPVHPDENVDARTEDEVVDPEDLAHATEVALALGQIVVAVIRHEQRVHAVDVPDHVGLEIAVLATGYRDDAVVIGAFD